MLLTEHAKYHEMGAKEANIREKTVMHISRQTTQTGEQLHCEVPIFPEDTRAEVKTRLNFFYSLMQDRLDDENKAVQAMNDRNQTIRLATEAMRRNHSLFQQGSKRLERELKAGKIAPQDRDASLAALKLNLETANKELQGKIAEIGDKHDVERADKIATEQARKVE